MITRRHVLLLGAGLLAAGCTPAPPASAPLTPTGPATSPDPTSASPSRATPTATVTATPTPTPTPTPTSTPDPFPGQSIASLRTETWGATGAITVTEDMGQQNGFHRYRISYPSDGFTIDGFMNVPDGAGPFPVVLLCHGYMPTGTYDLLTYTTPHADALARAGFLVVHPSYRNHRGSATGAPNEYRIGYARDVMHLTTLARRLPQADGKRVQLWGHSMGGGIDLRALAVRGSEYASCVLYGSMSGDEAANYRKLVEWMAQGRSANNQLPAGPDQQPALYAAISPLEYLKDLRVPVQIHHGELDEQVPVAWSRDLASRFTAWGVPHEYFEYPGGPHNLAGGQLDLLLQRCIAWFQQNRDR